MLYFCHRQKVTEIGRTKEAAGNEQVVNRESECNPHGTGDMPATLHNQHTYNTIRNVSTHTLSSLTSIKLFIKEKNLQYNNLEK